MGYDKTQMRSKPPVIGLKSAPALETASHLGNQVCARKCLIGTNSSAYLRLGCTDHTLTSGAINLKQGITLRLIDQDTSLGLDYRLPVFIDNLLNKLMLRV